jgi:hypothetical protein
MEEEKEAMERKSLVLMITIVFLLCGLMSGVAAAEKLKEIRIGTIGPITGWATIFGQGALTV